MEVVIVMTNKQMLVKITGLVTSGTSFKVGCKNHVTHSDFQIVISDKKTKKTRVSLQNFPKIYMEGKDSEHATRKLLVFTFKVYEMKRKPYELTMSKLSDSQFEKLRKMLKKIFKEKKH